MLSYNVTLITLMQMVRPFLSMTQPQGHVIQPCRFICQVCVVLKIAQFWCDAQKGIVNALYQIH